MDVLEVYHQTREAVDRCRQEKLPHLLEIKTYRYVGHSMSDPGTYRTRDEIAQYRQQDPILILKQFLTEASVISEENYQQMDQNCKTIAAESVSFAEQSAEPSLETIYEDLYV